MLQVCIFFIQPHCAIDLDECQTATHGCDTTHGICFNTTGSYYCQCKKGFTETGKVCNNVNECASGIHACSLNAVCIDTTGSYTCACKPGFNGNGNTCYNVDECDLQADSCDVNANCIDPTGSYKCACRGGY